jgi:peptidoglycan/LPS O-acetylase OafA/YrhL
MLHRSDIDGLRAIAILAVIGSHVGIPGMIGGFVGVDIFFVISGFLITGLLVEELRGRGRIDFAAFYARRFRRLLPALALVLVVTLVLGQFVLPPLGERQELGSSGMATSAFMSNIFFWRVNSDYFAPTAETLPLLATWTLAVEEQFYFVWPLALALVAVLARRRRWKLSVALSVTFVVLGVFSLALCMWATYARPIAAFYLMPPRAWEFAIGGLIALLVAANKTPTSLVGSVCLWSGLLLMLTAIVGFDEHTRFPGGAAIVPVMGAALFILGAPAAPLAWPVRYVLTKRPVVRIGLLSYSWYLWHWPLLALTRFQSLGETNRWRDVMVALVALLAADLTWRWVENPIRRGRPWPFSGVRTTVTAGITISAALVALSYGLYQQANRELHNDARLGQFYAARHDMPNWPAICSHYVRPFAQLSPVEACTLGTKGTSPSIVVWGDSHAFHFIPMAAEFSRRAGKAALGRTMGACPPLLGIKDSDDYSTGCSAFNDATIRELAELKQRGLAGVLIASRWYNLGPTAPRVGESGAHASPASPDLPLWPEALQADVDAITKLGLRILIVAPVPEFPTDPISCSSRLSTGVCFVARANVEQQRASAMAVLKRVATENPKSVRLWDPLNALCGADKCSAEKDGVFLYKDTHHLSVKGSAFLASAADDDLYWLAGR